MLTRTLKIIEKKIKKGDNRGEYYGISRNNTKRI